MRCGGCHSDNPEGNRFCDRCGAPLARACAACGYENRADAKFCGGCGKALEQAAPSPSPAPAGPRPLTVADYTPQHLAARILSSRLTLAGERKQVTVLFADIRGSTELIHGLDPEVALERLDPGLKVMMEAVHRYEGVVSRVQGDGIMALFGAPIAHEDHAVRACFAARAMLDGIARLEGTPLRIRVGMNSGEVVVRSVGNDLSLEYDAVGITVHLASRMEQIAAPGTACLSASTLKLARGFVEVRPLGAREVKGIAAPVEAFELGKITGRARWEVRAAAHGLSRFVGRETEMALLSDALKRTLAGRGQIAGIVGEPGVGKSRLVHEFLNAQPATECTVLRVGAMPHDRHTPFLLIAQLLRAWLGVADRDRQSEIGKKLTTAVAEIDGQLLAALAPLKSLLDLPPEDAEWERLDPPLRRQRMRDAVRLLLLKASAPKPLILVVEDLHWIDEESEAVLNAVAAGLGAARLLLLATFRPEYRHDWARHGYFSQVRANPLAEKAADELLQFMLGDGKGLEALRRRLIARCEGTPFFLEEMVRALSETGVLVEARLTRSLEEIDIPHSVQAVLAARIDRLSAQNRGVLQIASVIGKDVPLSLLQAVAAMSEAQLHERLDELRAAEFLYEVNLATGMEFTFKHALTHEVAYESMLLTRRRELHTQLVRAIEATYPDRLDELTERLAHHALTGEMWAQAVDYCFKAGQRANQRSAHREAIAYFRRALDALAHLPEERANIDRAIDIRLGLRIALAAAGKHLEIRTCLEEAEALAKSIDNKPRLALINISKCTILSVLGPLEEAIDAGRLGRDIATEMDDPASAISASYALGQAYWYRGDLQLAEEALLPSATRVSSGLELKSAGTTGSAAVLCVGCLANTYSFQGQFDKAFSSSAAALAIAMKTNRPYDLSYARIARGLAFLMKGELQPAIEDLEEALRVCRAGEIHLLVPAAARYLARAYALAQRAREAREIIEEALGLANMQTLASLQAWCGSSLALAHLVAGAWCEAEAAAAAALEHAQRHGYHPVETLALRSLALSFARRTPSELERAERLSRQALSVADKIGMRPEVAHCHADLAEIMRRSGHKTAAQRELATAIGLYRDMGMAWYIAQAEAASA
ncbi:MAG TPA: AAA family ATPase [Alphaproteobacteria bacterium]|nr:AAA family ATPase [Alphaproteobacteria bacterium]